jgi:hypothetical protein
MYFLVEIIWLVTSSLTTCLIKKLLYIFFVMACYVNKNFPRIT